MVFLNVRSSLFKLSLLIFGISQYFLIMSFFESAKLGPDLSKSDLISPYKSRASFCVRLLTIMERILEAINAEITKKRMIVKIQSLMKSISWHFKGLIEPLE